METQKKIIRHRRQDTPEMANEKRGLWPGQGVTWVVALYSSKVLVRLSAWRVRWESPKLTEAGLNPPNTLRSGPGGRGFGWMGWDWGQSET